MSRKTKLTKRARHPVPAKTLNVFEYLYSRWQDENEYEDFSEYRRAMVKALPRGAKLVKMIQSPFRVVFQWHGVRFIRIERGALVWGTLR